MKQQFLQTLSKRMKPLIQLIYSLFEQTIETLRIIILQTIFNLRSVQPLEQNELHGSQQLDNEQSKNQKKITPCGDFQNSENNTQYLNELQQLKVSKQLMENLKGNGDNEYVKQLISEKKIYKQRTPIFQISQDISVYNPEVFFFVLSEQLEDLKPGYFKKINPHQGLISNHFYIPLIRHYFDEINNDEDKKAKFILNFKSNIAQAYNIPIQDIEVLDLVKGSVIVIYHFNTAKETFYYNKVCGGIIEVYRYFTEGGIELEDFSPQFNKQWDSVSQEKTQRGPNYHRYDYYYPKGCCGYALNIKDRYGQDQRWLQKDGNEQEWRILFHGTKYQHMKPIVEKGLLPGGGQWYQSCYCQYTGQKVGSGVYFSNKIQVCLGYTQETLIKTYIGNRKFVLIFQSRVNPKAVRASKEMEQSGIFVVNNTFEIRPYRILLKQFI